MGLAQWHIMAPMQHSLDDQESKPQEAARHLLLQLLHAINTQNTTALAQYGIHDAIWPEVQEELQAIGDTLQCSPQLALAPQDPAFALFEMNPVEGQACWGIEAPLWVGGQHSDWTLRAEMRSGPADWVLLYRLLEVM